MSKWIDFNKLKKPTDRKTDIYQVVTKDGNTLLGQISWYGPWRQYAFMPNANTVFERQCLTDIMNFIKKIMDEKKELDNLMKQG